MEYTSIQWCDRIWNPTTGCTKVSAGCKNCYAERIFPRAYKRDLVLLSRTETHEIRRPRTFTDIFTHADRLDQPLHWRKPQRVFVNSMSDLFHEDVPDDFIVQCFVVMQTTKQHTYLILTKRPERAAQLINEAFGDLVSLGGVELAARHGWCHANEDGPWPLPNVWLGVSAENQETLLARAPSLLATPAAHRILSLEPLLGEIRLSEIVAHDGDGPGRDSLYWIGINAGIDQVIVGGESGPKARPCNIAWIESIVQQCKDARVACFVKQVGSAPYTGYGNGSMLLHRLHDRKGTDPLEWPESLRVREFPG